VVWPGARIRCCAEGEARVAVCMHNAELFNWLYSVLNRHAGASAPWTLGSASETGVPASGRNIFDVDDLT
jgi:hypothetical protein